MDDLRQLFDRARFRSEERNFVYGLVGKHNVDTSVSYAVPGRADFLYITIASKTVIIARNDAGVPQTEDYPVKLRRDSLGIFVIIARATNSTLGAPIATPPSGVVAHSTTHKHGGTDEVATATPGANAIVKAAGTGLIANGWLDATLASIAALGTVADRIAYTTALDTWAETPLTAFARTFLDDANQAAGRTTLGAVGLTGNETVEGLKTFLQATIGNAVMILSSTATNDDPAEIRYQNRAATADATVTTLHTFTIPASTTVALAVCVVARRTGGAAGTAEDGAFYDISCAVKNVAGTATLIGAVTVTAKEDQAGWDATVDVTGATAHVRVTGAMDNDVTWHMHASVMSVGT
jgi:hypothetical protein